MSNETSTGGIPCPNCRHQIPYGVIVCPNCGWDAHSPSVWPPPTGATPPTGQPVKSVMSQVGSAIGKIVMVAVGLGVGLFVGVAGGFVSIMTGSKNLVFVIGPIFPIALFLASRKAEPFFAYPLLMGAAVGLWGMNACAHWSFNGGGGH